MASCGDGSMKAIELNSIVTNSVTFNKRCASAAAAAERPGDATARYLRRAQ